MDILIYGSTGMVGQGVLLECLRADDVKSVTVVVRSPLAERENRKCPSGKRLRFGVDVPSGHDPAVERRTLQNNQLPGALSGLIAGITVAETSVSPRHSDEGRHRESNVKSGSLWQSKSHSGNGRYRQNGAFFTSPYVTG